MIADGVSEQRQLRQQADELDQEVAWLRRRQGDASGGAECPGPAQAQQALSPRGGRSPSTRGRVATYLSDSGPKTQSELFKMLVEDGCEDSDKTRKSL